MYTHIRGRSSQGGGQARTSHLAILPEAVCLSFVSCSRASLPFPTAPSPCMHKHSNTHIRVRIHTLFLSMCDCYSRGETFSAEVKAVAETCGCHVTIVTSIPIALDLIVSRGPWLAVCANLGSRPELLFDNGRDWSERVCPFSPCSKGYKKSHSYFGPSFVVGLWRVRVREERQKDRQAERQTQRPR